MNIGYYWRGGHYLTRSAFIHTNIYPGMKTLDSAFFYMLKKFKLLIILLVGCALLMQPNISRHKNPK